MDAKISIRSLEASDINFIYSTYLRGLYYGNDYFKEMQKDAFFSAYEARLLSLLVKPSINVRIACLSDSPDIILGYALLEPKTAVAHFVFVKEAWRKQGIAKTLLNAPISTVTSITKLGNELRKRKQWVFNPFAI